jgi:DNA-binding transcriptional LysR family regulator
MDFKEQKAILTIWQCQNITMAAEKLHITQPALSRLLKSVEIELGMPLFIRNNKHFAITAAGKLYIEKANEVLRCHDELEQGLQQLRQEEKTLSLKIGMQTIRAPRMLPCLYEAFASIWPECQVSFKDMARRELLQMLEQKDLDIILLNQVDLPPELDKQVIRKDTLLLVSGISDKIPCIPATDGQWDMVDLEKLQDKKFYMLQPHTTLYMLAHDIFRRYNLKLPLIQEIQHQESALHMAILNGGVTFTLDSYLSLFKLPGEAHYYRIKQHLRPVNYVAVYQKGRFTSSQLKLIKKILAKI